MFKIGDRVRSGLVKPNYGVTQPAICGPLIDVVYAKVLILHIPIAIITIYADDVKSMLKDHCIIYKLLYTTRFLIKKGTKICKKIISAPEVRKIRVKVILIALYLV